MKYTDYYVLLKRHFPTYHRFMHALAARYALGSETDADLELMTTVRVVHKQYHTIGPELSAEEVEKIKLMGLFARENNE
jgi:hypothetical protein